jgi:hypothetical protein
MMQQILRSLIVVLFAAALFGCKGGDGAAGLQGPPGTANVLYSAWFTPNPWVKDTVFGTWGFTFNHVDSNITRNLLETGVVLTYGKLTGYNPAIWDTNKVSLLPILIVYNPSGTVYTDTWSSILTPANIRIRFVDDKNLYNSISTTHKFRYVIIPGGGPLAKQGVAPIDYNNYEAVKEYYHIRD